MSLTASQLQLLLVAHQNTHKATKTTTFDRTPDEAVLVAKGLIAPRKNDVIGARTTLSGDAFVQALLEAAAAIKL